MDKVLLKSDPLAFCEECPRACGASRSAGQRGLCGADHRLMVARAALHYWEEPPISGQRGSGAIFLSHCPLCCCYCQNATIATGDKGREITQTRLAEICLELESQGALNINFVTPTHYSLHIRAAIGFARRRGLSVPVVWNTSGYETVESIKANSESVDVYLTDFKYADSALSQRYSKAPDYPQVAMRALEAMVLDRGNPVYDLVDDASRMVKGVIVRHLMLPGALEDSKRIVRMVNERFGKSVRLSLMNQYTSVLAGAAKSGDPFACQTLERCPELAQCVSHDDYEQLLDYADEIGVSDYFWQEGGTCEESYIPSFDFSGV